MDIKNVMHVSFSVSLPTACDLLRFFQIINYDLPSAEHGGIDEYVHRIGRTARIGNLGRATSFYNDRDAGLAQNLVKVLLECNQDIPDFLKEFQPEDKVVTWDDDTDDEGEASDKASNAGAEGGGWGQQGGVSLGLGAGIGDVVEKATSGGWGDAAGPSKSGW